MSDTKAGAILTGSNMKPGDIQTGEVTIKNTGSIAGTFKLSEANVTNGFAAGDLHLKIEDTTAGGNPIYNGDLGKAGAITLGSFADGEAHTYKFTVTLDTNAGDIDQGKSATADYEWNAVQS